MNKMFGEIGKSRGARVLYISALFLFCLAIANPPPLFAQNYNGSVSGTVTDPSGAAVAGATVSIINPGTNASYSATTTDLGAYSVPNLPVGRYEVRIRAGNFKEYVAKNVEGHTSSVPEVNAQLPMGAATEQVKVQQSDIQVQTTSAAVGEVIEGRQAQGLPLNGEKIMQLGNLFPRLPTPQNIHGNK